MFKRSGDGISIEVSIRLIDDTLLIGSVNCGMQGKLESLLAGDAKFVEFVSKEGQQRFIASHQIASVEPMASLAEPSLMEPDEKAEPYYVLGIIPEATMGEAMAAFQNKLVIYNPERWSGPEVPFEFSRFAVQKSRQINAAFTVVKGELKTRDDTIKAEEAKVITNIGNRPLFSRSSGNAA